MVSFTAVYPTLFLDSSCRNVAVPASLFAQLSRELCAVWPFVVHFLEHLFQNADFDVCPSSRPRAAAGSRMG